MAELAREANLISYAALQYQLTGLATLPAIPATWAGFIPGKASNKLSTPDVEVVRQGGEVAPDVPHAMAPPTPATSMVQQASSPSSDPVTPAILEKLPRSWQFCTPRTISLRTCP
jgi:hypothetical protein